MVYSSILVGYVMTSHLPSGLWLDLVVQSMFLFLRIAICCNPLLSSFYNDCIFRWRATCCLIVIRLRKYFSCLIFSNMNPSFASCFGYSSRWFEASRLIAFRCFFESWRCLDMCLISVQIIVVGEWLKCVIRLIILSIANCRGCLLRMEESVIFKKWASRRTLV